MTNKKLSQKKNYFNKLIQIKLLIMSNKKKLLKKKIFKSFKNTKKTIKNQL